MSNNYNLIIAVTGSVATVKLAQVIRSLRLHFQQADLALAIKVVATRSSLNFFDRTQIEACVLTDDDEWSQWNGAVGVDPVLHIELRKWANAMLIAPLSANSLAKLANGLCDNLLTCVYRAWDVTRCPVYLAPAMNTFMWTHPHTQKHLHIVCEELGATLIPVVSKRLACGDTGVGAMAEPDQIARVVLGGARHSE